MALHDDQSAAPQLPMFNESAAWELGQMLTERAIERDLSVAIDIRRPTHILFRAMLPGTAPDQESWLDAKSAIVFRYGVSSAVVAARMTAYNFDPIASGWLDASAYALAGGSVPIRVADAGVVAAVTISGLSSEDDHEFAMDGIVAYLAYRGEEQP